MSERGCLWWTGRSYDLACPDDLCRGSGRTICGLEEGIDFGVEDDEDFDNDWDWGDYDDESDNAEVQA